MEHLERDFEAASKRVKQGLTMRAGGSAAEAAYSATYQALVRVGLRPQIRGKYRGR